MDPVWVWGGIAVVIIAAVAWAWHRSGRSPAVGAPVKMRGYAPNIDPVDETVDAWEVSPVRTARKQDEISPEHGMFPLGIDASVRDLDTATTHTHARVTSPKDAASNDAMGDQLARPRRRRATRPEAVAPPAETLVVVLNLIALGHAHFAGTTILERAHALRLELGRRGIFHCPDPDDAHAPPLFSMVNAVEPGTFDIQRLATTSTPGLCFILQLPGPSDALVAFTRMYNTASQLAAELQGEVCDARRQPLTLRGVESMRAEILEYQRRQWDNASR